MISEDKNDPASHSGSESSASEELSQHSTSNITSSSSTSNSAGPIIAAFANSANAVHRRNLASTTNANETSLVSLTSAEDYGLNEIRNHNIAHFTTSPQNAGFFHNGGHLGHGGLHMMSTGGYSANPAQLGHHSPEHHNGGNGGGGGVTEANRKRAVRLQKNREAARECRRKKKEYIKCLENRVAVLENQNKALIEELRSLKELYSGNKSFSQHDVPKIEIL